MNLSASSESVATGMGRDARLFRLLNVCPYPVLPATAGGKVRIVKLARRLAQLGVDVTLMTPYHPRQTRQLIEREPFRVVQVPYPFILPLLLTDRPLPYQYWTSFHPGLNALLSRHISAADIVQFEHVQFGKLSLRIPREQIVVYGSHNVEYDYARAECRSEWSADLVGRRIARLEEDLIARSDHVFAVSAGDCRRLADLYGADAAAMTVAPNGIDAIGRRWSDDHRTVERFPGLSSFASRGLYSGSDVAHNRAAVHFILAQVAPRRPDVGFVIHGSCGNSFARACRLPNVFFDPAPDRFQEYTGPGFRGLNPVTIGSGSNLKLLHYLSHGMPVTSTPFGMRGFEDLVPYATVCEPEHVWESFDDTARPAVPESVLRKYEWSTIAAAMLCDYRKLILARS